MKLASRLFHGRRPASRTVARIAVPLAGLAAPRYAAVPHGAIAAQGFRVCRPCGGVVPVVLHPGGVHSCEAGHITIPGGTR